MQNQNLDISNFKSRKNRKNFHKTLFKAHKWKKEYFDVMYTSLKNKDANWDPLIHITQPNSISFYIKSCQKFILALDWCVCGS